MLTVLMILVSVLIAVLIGFIAFRAYQANAKERGATTPSAPGIEMVSDLDAIISKTVAFKYQGKAHYIPPLSMIEFVEAAVSLNVLEQLKTKKDIQPDELLDAYAGLFAAVCPTIKRSDVEAMQGPQLGALLNLVMEVILGKANLDAQKKSSSDSNEQQGEQGSKSTGQF